jgi:hypothetical protein
LFAAVANPRKDYLTVWLVRRHDVNILDKIVPEAGARAHGNSDRQKSRVVESRAYRLWPRSSSDL